MFCHVILCFDLFMPYIIIPKSAYVYTSITHLMVYHGLEAHGPQDGYPVALWEELTPEVLPGFEGFNRRATAVMIKAEVGQGQLQVGDA